MHTLKLVAKQKFDSNVQQQKSPDSYDSVHGFEEKGVKGRKFRRAGENNA